MNKRRLMMSILLSLFVGLFFIVITTDTYKTHPADQIRVIYEHSHRIENEQEVYDTDALWDVESIVVFDLLGLVRVKCNEYDMETETSKQKIKWIKESNVRGVYESNLTRGSWDYIYGDK